MRDYNAPVEVAHRPDPYAVDADFGDDVIDRLLAASPAIGISERGWMDVTITRPANSLLDASATALALVKAATGHEPVSVEVMPTAEFDKRNGISYPMPDLVSVSEAAQILGVSRQAVLDRITRKTLPATKVGREYAIQRASVAKGD